MSDVHEIYLQVRPEDIAYIQAVFDSYEGVGVIRTVDRKKAIIVLLAVDGLLGAARSIISFLRNEISLTEVSRPTDIGEDWLLRELDTTSMQDAECKM